MDNVIDLEGLRAKLAAMSRAEARKVAEAAGLACSTVEKFRLNHIREPKLSKLQKLMAALTTAAEPEPKVSRKRRA